MIFRSLSCACALIEGARNRSGLIKISAAAVRSVLSDGLDHPRGVQTARAGLHASTAFRLYRSDLN
ncbi:hypothetical protein [Alicycliphilus denitrificans]|uniref:hypothetical protein n=1 Tax=Alicycliphilus denitrificans TaxID=179636 RepID=UPI001915CE6F|nr:hypothetical protein [Alicycliphilus denitrificans]